MSDAHQFVAWGVVVVTVGLLVASAWSTFDARRTHGARDHRFAVDRLVLVALAAIAINIVVGALVYATGARPVDALHLLYGPAALVTLPVGWWLAAGRGRTTRGESRGLASTGRRDAWLLVASIVLLGLEVRLFMTG